jgi:L-asparaginase
MSATAAAGRPRVSVISLGGTIASAPGGSSVLASPRLSAEELIASVPQISEVADLTVANPVRLPSSDLTVDIALGVADAIREAEADGVSGIVVTQGTDTIEEMSFALDILARVDIPVAVTGAMRHAGLPGADGPANLLDAVRVAACEDARGLGVLVVMNGGVHSAVDVRKLHTSSPAAFASPNLGPVGWLSEGHVRLRDRPHPRLEMTRIEKPLPRVPVIKICLGDDGWWLDAVRGAANGLVLEAFGGGHLPGWLAEDVGALARDIPVVLTSRTGEGEVLRSTYGGFPGSESDLLAAGLLPAGTLSALKARLLLMLLLASGAPREQMGECFAALGSPQRSGRLPGQSRVPQPDEKE